MPDIRLKTRHDIMVPLGPKAFMPGQIVHTNEVLVLLGENYFVERTAKQASGIIERRLGVINGLISTTEKRAADLAARADLSDQAKKAMGEIKSASTPAAPVVKQQQQQQPASRKPPAEVPASQKRVQIQEDEDVDEVEDEAEEEDQEEEENGLGLEFWAAAGFTGAWADDPRDRDDEEDEEGDTSDYASTLRGIVDLGGGMVSEETVWDDDNEPVFEIIEKEGAEEEGKVVQHASQKTFQQGPSYPY